MYLRNLLFALLAIIMLSGCGSSQPGSDANATKKISGKLVGSELQVSVATDDQANPRVVYLPDKELYFVVWEDYRNRNTTGADIYGQFLTSDGKACGTDILLSKNGTDALNGNQTLPDVAYRQNKATPASSSLVVIWQDSFGSTNGGYVRFAKVSNLPANTDATQSCGTTAPAVSNAVPMGFTQMQKYSAVTNQSTAVQVINGNSTATTNLTPYVVPGSVSITGTYTKVLGSPDTIVTVNATDDGEAGIAGAGVSATSGGSISYNTGLLSIILADTIPAGATPANLTVTYKTYATAPVDRSEDQLLSRKSPRIGYDSVRDEFWTTWVESRNTNNVSSVTCFGVPVTWQFGDSNLIGYARINNDGANFNANGLGVIGADIYRNEFVPGHRTFFNRLVSHTATATDEIYNFEYFTNVNNPVVASDPTSPETFIAWEGTSNTGTIKCTLDTTTKVITSVFSSAYNQDGLVHIYGLFDKYVLLSNTYSPWIDFQNTASGTNPSIAVDDTSSPRKFLVAWEDMRDGANTKIYGQLINSGGGLYNSNRIISFQDSAGSGVIDDVIKNSRQTRPTVSYDAVNQRYFVMWQDERNSSTSLANIDLFGQFVNLDGSLSGANYSISSAASNQLAPAIAYDQKFKQFLAVWKDARNINFPGTTASDIYGQIFSIGQPQLTLLTDTVPQLQLVPAVHDFGAVESGVWKFVVKNTGDTTLVVNKIADTALPAAPFTIAPTNAATLAPGSSATYTVTFSPTSSGTYNSSFTLTSDGGNQTVALSATGTILAPLSITTPATTAWPDASAVGDYSLQLVAAGGYTPLTWEASGLPPQLSIHPTSGKVTGTNPALGNYTVTVKVTDGATPANTATRNYTLRVGSAINISTTPLSTWTLGAEYSASPVHSLSSTGGTNPVTWSILTGSGVKPPGIDFSETTGIFSGTATASGTFDFYVLATDAALQTSQAQFSITINPAPSITTSSVSSGVVGFAYSQQLDMTGGTTPIVWSKSGALPPGLQFNAANGSISGTPTSAGSYDFSISVTDAAGISATKTYNLTIYPTFAIATPSAGTGAPPPAVVGAVYKNFTFKTNYGGAAPYSWVKSSGALPAGLTLNQDTGVLSGTPTAAGDYTFALTVTDTNGANTTKTFLISVLEASTSTNVQIYGQTNAVVSSYSAVALTDLAGTPPAGVSPSSASQMQITGLAFGETVSVAASFVSIPSNPVYYIVSGTDWTAFTPDSVVNNTIFFKVKDRSSATDTDSLAQRDSNPASGIIESTVVVATAGTSTSGSTSVGTVSSSGSGSGCFIATAAYGSYLDPHVKVLRNFRDDVLLHSKLGTAFVKCYYAYSPPIADYIANHGILRVAFRLALTPLIFAVEFPFAFALLFATAAVMIIRRRLSLRGRIEMVQQAG